MHKAVGVSGGESQVTQCAMNEMYIQKHSPRSAKVNFILHTATSKLSAIGGRRQKTVDEDKVSARSAWWVRKELQEVEAVGAFTGPCGLHKRVMCKSK